MALAVRQSPRNARPVAKRAMTAGAWRGVWLVALLHGACLPVLSDKEIAARIAASSDAAGSKDVTGSPDGAVSPDATVKPGACGNKVLDPGEACDDGNAAPCDACDKCQIRRALDVNDDKALVLADAAKLALVKGSSYSVSVWFKVRKFPGDDKSTFFVALLSDKYDEALLALGLFKPKGVNTGLPFCKFPATKLTEKNATLISKTPVQLDTWHHLRCFYGGGKASLSLDGAPPEENSLDLAVLGAKQGSKLAFGHLAIGELAGFDGWLDELHLQANVPDNVWQKVLRRVPDGEAGVALFHMDAQLGAKSLADTAADPADAKQAKFEGGKAPTLQKHELSLAPEACYDYAADAAACTAAGKAPPWCAKP